MNRELWEKCVAFHGHECPGLAIGFRAAQLAMERLGEFSSMDEELVCVTENDACGVDAVQVITGCTMGKGNLVHRPTGKMAYSFFNRAGTGKVRILFKLKKQPEMIREEWMRHLLEVPAEDVFSIQEPHFAPPERARIFASVDCEVCGETASEYRIRLQEGKKVCLDCFQAYERGL